MGLVGERTKVGRYQACERRGRSLHSHNTFDLSVAKFVYCPQKYGAASQERMPDASPAGWELGKRALCRQKLAKDSFDVLSKK